MAKYFFSLIFVWGISLGAAATNYVDGEYVWQFLSGENWPIGYDQNTGKPDDLVWAKNEYPSEFFSRINNALPESYVNEAFLTDDSGSNITLQDEAEVSITFIHEGAGYKNSFGFFTFDKDNPPTRPEDIDEVIVFPNLSYPHLTNGHRLSLGSFPAGTSIGFFIAANGFWYDTGVKPFPVPYYYSLKGLNPDPTDELKQHNVLIYDAEVEEVIIGFEDLPRAWGDNDFNDAVFSVKATPSAAIVTEKIVAMPAVDDSDADGIVDNEDEFPDDYRRAFSAHYPSIGDWCTLAFEDNWPEVGDYDMNDLVVRERLRTIYDASGNITGFKISGFIDARGASHHNGFGVRLIGVSPSNIAAANISIDGNVYEKVPEENQSEAVIIFWRDTHILTDTGQSGSCSHFNTVKECGYKEPIPFELDVSFEESPLNLFHSELDFFIFRTDYRGREVHFAGYAPTDLFDFTQLGKYDDTSNVVQGRFFQSAQNLPWALKIHTSWRYPREYIDVLWAYPDYEEWVESSGLNATDWYETSERNTHFY